MKSPGKTLPTRRTVLQDDVIAALKDAQARDTNRSRSPQQRVKAKRDRKRNRVTYDLPPALEDAVEDIARQEKVSKSGTAALLLAYAVHTVRHNSLTFYGLRTPSRSPLHEHVISEDDVVAVMEGRKKLDE